MTDDPLDRRISREDAARLLLGAADTFATGATILGSAESKADQKFSGLALITESSEVGQYVLAQYNRRNSFDNQTRWTLIDRDKRAKILLEVEELSDDRYVLWKGTVCFDYPEDRTALSIAAQTGWLALAVGDPDAPDPLANQPKSLMGLELSTHDQLKKMLDVMDARNPETEPVSVEKVYREITNSPYPYADEMQDALASFISSWDPTEGGLDSLAKVLKEHERPFAAVQALYETFAIAQHLSMRDEGEWLMTDEIASYNELNVEATRIRLRSIFENDNPWVKGRLAPNGEWEWQIDREREFPKSRHGEIRTRRQREKIAKELLRGLGVEVPLSEVSPALAMAQQIDSMQRAAAAYMELLHKKAPVWAGARGFSMTYDECVRRARVFREMQSQTDEMTVLHCQVGLSMRDAHVLTVGTSQVTALPELDEQSSLAFLRGTPLPFEPFFIDFSAEDKLPWFDVNFAREGEVKVLGVLVSEQRGDDDEREALFITPIFLYSSIDIAVTGASAVGSMIVNLTDNKNQTFYWLGSANRFEGDSVIALAHSPFLDGNEALIDAYHQAIGRAAGLAFSVLHLLDYSNVELVEKPLEKRDRKRAEKRDWDIPMVVRVSRPSRRVVRGETDGMNHRDFSHQFDVIGHPKHFTKGPMVRCLVCQGKTNAQVPCSRCNSTGLDPEKVEPCTRINIKTGEKTCPNGCRRVWCPSYVKGNPEGPYIPKVRKLI